MTEQMAYAAARRLFADALVERLALGDIARVREPLAKGEWHVEIMRGGEAARDLYLSRREGEFHVLDGGFGSRVRDRPPAWVVSQGRTEIAALSFDPDDAGGAEGE